MKTQSILNTILLTAGFSAFALIGSASAAPDVIDPTGATATGTVFGRDGGDTTTPTWTIDSSGLFAGANYAPTGSAVPVTWSDNHTDGDEVLDAVWAGSDGTATLTYDLGASYNVTGFHMWSENDDATSDPTSADVMVSTTADFSSGVTDLGTMTFLPATQTDLDQGTTYLTSSGTSLDLSATGEYVRFSDFTSANNILSGVSEIRFIGSAPAEAPEPSTYALMGLGALALLVVSRRRRTV